MISAPAATPPEQSVSDGAQPVLGHPRGGGWSGGGEVCFYAFPTRQEDASFDVVISCIVLVCHKDDSVLFDPGSTYSYVSSYFSHYLDIPRDSFVMLVHVSIQVGDSIVVDHVYRSCIVTIGGYETRVDLILFMVDFDVILGINWLSPYHTIFDCHAKIVTLAIPGLPRLEWRCSLDHVTGRVISYLKTQ